MTLPAWFINTPKQHGHGITAAPKAPDVPAWLRPRKPGRKVRRAQAKKNAAASAHVARLTKGLNR